MMKARLLTLGLFSVLSVLPAGATAELPKASADLLLIDVRSEAEYGAWHAPGAVNIPYDVIVSKLREAKTPMEKPILLYCRSGRRSGIAATNLKAEGYTQVHNAGGLPGIKGWIQKSHE